MSELQWQREGLTPLFKKKALYETELDDEYQELSRSIRERGMAKISEANAYADAYLEDIAKSTGLSSNPDARLWLRDRFRFFLVVGTPGWFNILDRVPEGPALRPEWVALTQDRDAYGPGELIAWWWLVHEKTFRPAIENQLGEMRGALSDGALEIAQRGGDFKAQMVAWDGFFGSR